MKKLCIGILAFLSFSNLFAQKTEQSIVVRSSSGVEESFDLPEGMLSETDSLYLFLGENDLRTVVLKDLDNAVLSPDDKMYQCAQGVACAANSKEKISASALMPIYLRLSQAERELKLKKER